MKKETIKKVINLIITELTAVDRAYCVKSCQKIPSNQTLTLSSNSTSIA